MNVIYFEVIGTPAPQGSKSRMPNGAMVEGRSTAQRQRHTNWRGNVAARARTAADTITDSPLTGPLALTVNFRFPMPKSRSKTIRARGVAPKTSAPDLDKLIRSTGDALKEGGLITDDALITWCCASKHEVTTWTGAEITIQPINTEGENQQ